MQSSEDTLKNPLATEKIPVLLVKFSVPAVIGFLVSALYNIVDQIFIGQGVGLLGNAATNVAFPIATVSTALALLLGIGGAANFNIEQGRGNRKKAAGIAGNSLSAVVFCGFVLTVLILLFLKPLLYAFGATETVYPFARAYTEITALGLPFIIFSIAGSHLVRAAGHPTYSMICQMSGALLNTILDPLFIFGFDMGIEGAAWATVLSQLVSAILVFLFFFRNTSMGLAFSNLRPKMSNLKAIVSLGAAPCFNQLAMTLVQIVMNNTLTHYGALSRFGSDTPLACVGVISKVNILYIGIILGIGQGSQPILGFNYGAKNYDRVKKTYTTAVLTVTAISIITFLCFQLFPRTIISIFGQGSEVYFEFSVRYLRIFMFMTFANGIQPLSANFFTSIGKAKTGILISMTRQIIFLVPLVLIFPLFLGIDGVLYAGPIADGAASILALLLILREMRRLDILAAS